MQKNIKVIEKILMISTALFDGITSFLLKKLTELTNITDPYRLDMDLDHLAALGSLRHGVAPASDLDGDCHGEFYITTLAVYLYIRCQGAICDPVEFFGSSALRARLSRQLTLCALPAGIVWRKRRDAQRAGDYLLQRIIRASAGSLTLQAGGWRKLAAPLRPR